MDKTQTILVTGGLGYIGSHLSIELLSRQYNVVILDNYSNNFIETIDKAIIYKGDIRDSDVLKSIFKQHNIDFVVHLAGLKSVKESIQNPDLYYDVNINGLTNLLNCTTCRNIIFASSASIYGSNKIKCSTHTTPKPDNPYAQSKLTCEEILKHTYNYNISILRIFNPIGFKIKGKLNKYNLIDNICNSILNKTPIIIHNQGKDIRDYIYIDDLVLKILECLNDKTNSIKIKNIGSGVGVSTNEILDLFYEIESLIEYDNSDNKTKLVSKSKTKNSKILRHIIDEIRDVMLL